MNTRTSPRSRTFAFTLLELLTVIGIIAILMAILIPTVREVPIMANKQRAHATAKNIVASIVAYQTEYAKYPTIDPDGTFPAPTPESNEDTIVGDKDLIPNANIHFDNSALFNTLRGIDKSTNSRQIVFYEDRTVTNPDLPKGGFLDKPSASGSLSSKKGCLFDPWGSEYFIVLDTNYDNQINIGAIYQDFSFPADAPRVGVGAFSLGPDRQVGSKDLPPNTFQSGTNISDDLVSWK